ncbi:caspase family protein [Marivirga sp. S37H4]|uniref:Caspase family protein n=1 Tax=Marivirga aurantiaca TaxID=2802615 RepID=A0A934X1I8_9BACT|nr:caspase family protein [Marivirga aurantiaca]MBK6267273.1 caspase family protein [Marivirga aurantiaca]
MRTPLLLIFLFAYGNSLFAQSLSITLQKGHSEPVKALQLSQDGKYLFTGSRDKTIKLWDVETAREINTFFGHSSTINGFSINNKTKQLTSSSADLTVKVWDITTAKAVWTSSKSQEYMTDVALSPDGKYVATGGFDKEVIIYELSTGDSLLSFPVASDKGTGYGVTLDWSNDGQWLAVGEDNRTLSIYDAETWRLKQKIKPETGWCGGCPSLVAFHPNSKQIAKLSDNGSLELIEVVSGNVIHTLKEKVEDIRAVAFSENGEKLLAATQEQVFIYSLASNKLTATLNHRAEINDVIFNKEADAVIIAGNDNKATMIDIASGEIHRQFEGLLHDQDKGGLMYDPNNYWESHIARYIKNKNSQVLTSDDAYLLKGKISNVLRMWEVKSGKSFIEFSGHEKAVIDFELSPDEKMLATAGGEGDVIVWETQSGKSLKLLQGHRSPVFDVRWSHDQTKLVSTSWDGQVLVWDLTTEKIVSNIYQQNTSAYAVSFTHDDLYLIVASLDKKLELYEVATGQLVKTFIGHTQNVNEIILSDQAGEFMSLSDDGTAISWNIYDGMMRKRFSHPMGTIRAGMFHNDHFLSGGEDRIIRIWDRKSGKIIQTFEGHQATVSSLNIHKSDNLLISGDLDGVTKFWDLKTGKEILEHIIIDKANWMVRNPSGYFYATDGAKKYIHYTKDNKAYLLDQFFEEFFTPDLISNTFSENGTKSKKSIQGLLENSSLPEVKIAGIKSGDELEAAIYIKVSDDKGIEDMELFHNGKRVAINLQDFKKSKQKDNSTIYSCVQPLVSGHNRFMAKVVNREKLESAPAEIDLITQNNVPGATCHVLAIGVNDYKNTKLNLNYARADAEAFVGQMSQQTKGLFSSFKKHELYDRDATKQNILSAMDSIIATAAIDDLFVLYFAGHGSMNDETFYFIPHESTRLYEGSALKKQALSADEVQQKLTRLKALKQIIFIDACQSGGSVELLARRGATEEKAIAQLSRSAGVHVLSAAGNEQYASEFADLGHGLFTYAVLKALRGEADTVPKDGRISVYEMKSFIDEIVPELNMRLKGNPQYPYTFSRGNDFPIGVLKE